MPRPQDVAETKPTSASASFIRDVLRRHGAFLAILALATPAIFLFARGPGLASLGDDSVSYVMLARHMLFPADAQVNEWIGHVSHFPPAFPLALALSGTVSDLARGHLAVAVFAVLALVATYRFAAGVLESTAAAAGVVLLFLITPSAWISIKGILSESMFLFVSMAALAYHRSRLEPGGAKAGAWLAFGALLGLTVLTRTIGVALVAAYVLHAAIRIGVRRERPILPFVLPLLSVAAMVAAWLLWRPALLSNEHERVFRQLLALAPQYGLGYVGYALANLARGWIASFTASSHVYEAARWILLVPGVVGVAGAVLRSARNRIDGWYVLASLAILGVWQFPEENTRRLMYPLVPLLLIQAACFLRFASERAGLGARRGAVLGMAALLPAILALPAWLLVQQKNLDRAPMYPGWPYVAADITDYYNEVNVARGREFAARQIAFLAGLEQLPRLTPPGAKVMWSQPAYPVVLGHRRGVASYFRWSAREFAEHLRGERVDYVVWSTMFKADVLGERSEPEFTVQRALPYARPVLVVESPVSHGNEFILTRIDLGDLARYLAHCEQPDCSGASVSAAGAK